MGYVATAVVNTEEGAALAPGEVVGENFDPEAEHNAALIEEGLLRASDGAQSASKSSGGESTPSGSGDAQAGAESSAGGAGDSGSVESVKSRRKRS